MARKRMIDPTIWQSEDFGKLSNLAKIVFIGLFSLADDEGRGRANSVYLKNMLFPYDEYIKTSEIEKALFEINTFMSIVFYSVDDNQYYELYSWNKFQTINRPSESKIPQYVEGDSNTIQRVFSEYSVSPHGCLTPNRREKKRIEKKGIEEEKNREESVGAFTEIYARECFRLPQIKTVTDSRIKAIGLFKKTYTLKDWEEVCKIANNTDFLLRCKR